MDAMTNFFLTEEEKDEFIESLTPDLATLRTKAGVSQEELANIIGVSRQTYGSIERKNRKMAWSTYLSLIMFYDFNRATHSMIRKHAAFPHKLIKRFNENDEPSEFELGMLFKTDTSNIINSLDEQALATLRTVLMVEYSRCNNLSGDAVIKFFDGVDLSRREPDQKQVKVSRAIKNIKRKK